MNNDLISRLFAFTARTKRLLNTYPFEVHMNDGAMVEFSDKFCSFATPTQTGNSILGIPVWVTSLVPDHEAWFFYRDETIPGGCRVEKIRWEP